MPFQLESVKRLPVIKKSQKSQYDGVCGKIDKHIADGGKDWLKISGFNKTNIANNAADYLRKRYKDAPIKIVFRKYNQAGEIENAVYVKLTGVR